MKSLIFDIDGTLWDSRAIVAEGYNDYLRQIGRPDLQVDAEYLKTLFGKTMTEIADIMLCSIPVPQRYDVMLGCMDREDEFLHNDPCDIAFPGVKETLEKLKEDYRLFIVSNAQCGYPELMMDKLGIRHLFEGWMCFGDTGLPKGDTIRILMERHGITDAVYIGDTQGDLEASRKAGIPFIFCTYGFCTPEAWDAALEDFCRLPALLRDM